MTQELDLDVGCHRRPIWGAGGPVTYYTKWPLSCCPAAFGSLPIHPFSPNSNLRIHFLLVRLTTCFFPLSFKEEESGSSTDMSICRSGVLFSSMRDSATAAAAAGAGVLGAAEGDCAGGGDQRAAADSLIMGEDGCGDFSYGDQVKVNKNNYTLTFSRSDGSMIASTASGCGTTDILADTRPTGTIIRRKDRGIGPFLL